MKPLHRNQSLRAEAANPATLAPRLCELAGRGHGKEVAANPNTPMDLLLRLAARHFDAFLANPVLPLLLLEDPGFFLKLSPASLRRLLRRENLPETLLASLARHKDAEVRESAALHVREIRTANETGDPVLRSLAGMRADTAALPELFELGLVPAWLSEPLAGTVKTELRDFVISVLEKSENGKMTALGELYRRAGAAAPRPGQPSRPDMDLSAEEMRRLAAGGPWVRAIAARHPNTPPESLAQLARDSSLTVRAAALRHPCTPEEALWPGSAAVLPVLRVAVARNPAATDAMLTRLAADPDPAVRRAVAGHRYLEPKALGVLASDADASIRARVARNRLTPPNALEKLSTDADVDVRRGVAVNTMTPPSVFTRLAADPNDHVRAATAKRCDLPDDLLCVLACDADSHVCHRARFNRSNPRDLTWELMHLTANDMEAVRRAVARGKRRRPKRAAAKPIVRSYRFSFPTRRWQEPADPHHMEKHTAALESKTPPEVLARLVQEQSPSILSALAGNTSTPVETLRKLPQHPRRTWHMYHILAMNRNLPPDLIQWMAEQPNAELRGVVCCNASIPTEVLAKLALDPEASVRRYVASISRTPPETLLALCEDKDVSIHKALLANSSLPWSALERWLPLVERDTDWRQTLAYRTDLPKEWRERLAHDPEVSVRMAFTNNTVLSLEEFELLANDPEPSVRSALTQRSHTWPTESLEDLARTDDPLRLAMVARAPNLPAALAERLATHPAAEVRVAVAYNRAAPDAALARLAGDPEPTVQQALRTHPRCPPEAVDRWLEADFPKSGEIYSILNCPGLREHHYRKLLAAGNEEVRRSIVFNGETPLPIVEELLNGEDLKKLDHIARNRRLPERMYEAIIAREDAASLRHYTAASYHTPSEVAQRIALTGIRDDWWERRTRVMLARQADVGADFLCRLLEREISFDRPDASGRMRRHYHHRDSDVLAVLAARPEIPVQKLEPLLNDDNPGVRRALIARKDLPAEWRIRLRTAALERAVNGRTSWARLAALCHPETKADALRTFARTGRWLERLAVARNPAAPAEVLEVLGTDSNSVIRTEARAQLEAIQRSKS